MIAERLKSLPVSELTDKEVEAEFFNMMDKMQAHEKARPERNTKSECIAEEIQ